MTKFVIRISLFLLPMFIIYTLLEAGLRRIPNDYAYKKSYLDKNAERVNTLILGSSHSFYGINPAHMKGNAFNASHISQSLDYDLEILTMYWKGLVNLKTVILPVSYFTLYTDLASELEAWRIKNYGIYYGITKDRTLANSFEITGNKFQVNLERISTFYLQNKDNISCSGLGWGTDYNSREAKDLTETAVTSSKRHMCENLHATQSEEIFRKNVNTLNSLIALCESKGINVILFTPPAFIAYRERLGAEQYTTMINTAQDISKSHLNCRYVNLIADERFSEGDYYDADHVNEKGAKKLSKIIDQLIPANSLAERLGH